MQYRDQRGQSRHETLFERAAGAQRATILDVSRTGGRGQGLARPQPGERVTLTVAGLPVEAEITRVDETGAFGFKFRLPIGKRQLEAIRQTDGSGAGAAPYRSY